MLNADNNKKIADLLISNEMNLNQSDNLDGTIFCIPYDIVCSINDYLITNNISLIENNDCCPEFYKVVNEIIIKKGNNNRNSIPLRHRWKHKLDDNNEFEQESQERSL